MYYAGDRCDVCGCKMGLKVVFEGARCPKGYWKQKMVEQAMGVNNVK